MNKNSKYIMELPTRLIYEDVNQTSLNQNMAPFCLKRDELENNEICFYKVNRLTFDEDYPHREAFENILQALHNEAFNFVYILDGSEEGINLYLGVVRNQNENKSVMGNFLTAANYGKTIASIFEGNFGGSVLEKLNGQKLTDAVLDSPRQFKNAGVIVGIPSVNEQKDSNSKYGFQGIDRLINSMMGLRWRLVVVCEPVPKDEIVKIRNDIYEIYDTLSPYAQRSVQHSKSSGATFSEGSSESKAKGVNFSENTSHTDGRSKGTQNERSNSGTNSSEQKGNSYGESTTNTDSTSKNSSVNIGNSQATTIEIVNKNSKEILKYIDEELLERVKVGFSRGLFRTSVYYMGENPNDANRLKIGIMSLFQGKHSSYSPLRAHNLDIERNPKILNSYQSFFVKDENLLPESLTLFSRPYINESLGLNTYMTTDEISLIAGLPQKEIPGISVKEGVDFGLNFGQKNGEVLLGNLIQKGRELPSLPVKIDRSVLNKHIFIAGVTGSGKTTTCHTLLKEAGYKFLVIEPAKTEYRALIDSSEFSNVIVFTVGDETTAPFRLNPFELVRGESVSAHIDMIKATFASSFPMEASMPQLLEEAICKIYEDKGWNLNTNRNLSIEKRPGYKTGDEFNDADAFPILSDFLKALNEIVESKGFSERLRDDYRGSLISRFSNLTKGSKGEIFNCNRSINFEKLIDCNVVIEMENLKSSEDKALLMGFILTRLSAVIKQRHQIDSKYRHITLIEEAHRLLSKVEYGDSGSKRTAVETFTDMLAEVRNYGESLVIIDQIPNKLASEVLKNTNTKIIHKLFARDDKEAVGDTMLMDDKQKEYLSALETGQAIVFTEGMSRPVHVKIHRITDTSDIVIPNERVRSQFIKNVGTVHYNAEIIHKLYSLMNDILQKISVEFKLEEDTSKLIDKLKSEVQQQCIQMNQNGFERDEEYIVEHLAKEFTKRNLRDDIFKERLTKFLKLLVFEDNFSLDSLQGDRNIFRLLDNLKDIYKKKP